MAPGAGSAPAPNESCAEKERLTNRYAVATSDLNRAALVLSHYLGTMSREEYDRLREFCKEAQEKSEEARSELERHIAEHRC